MANTAVIHFIGYLTKKSTFWNQHWFYFFNFLQDNITLDTDAVGFCKYFWQVSIIIIQPAAEVAGEFNI